MSDTTANTPSASDNQPAEDPRKDSLIEYPSLFPIKVMGANHPDLEQAVIDIALQFDPGYDRATLQLR